MNYEIMYIDPPWDYKGARVSENGTGSIDHYPSMTNKELMDLRIKDIAGKDSIMFMWTTGPKMDFATQLMRHWGWEYSTVGFVWQKMNKVVFGNYTMSSCEFCLIGKRGKIPGPMGFRSTKQFLQEERREHSRKPDTIRDMITAMFPTQKKIELFARQKHEGWDNWGNELDLNISISKN